MQISLAWALLLYFLLLVIFFVIAGINAFHIVRFGSFDRRNRVMVSLYAVVVFAVLVATVLYLAGVDWAEPIRISVPNATPSFPTP